MARVDVRCDDGVELQSAEAAGGKARDAVEHELFANVPAARAAGYSVARVCDVAAAADVVRVENVQPENFIALHGDSGGRLLREKFAAGLRRQLRLLRVGDAVADDLVPDAYHIRKVRLPVQTDFNAFHR